MAGSEELERSLTLGERVASIGRDLLGLSKAEALFEPGSTPGNSGPGAVKALLGGGCGGCGEIPAPRSPNSQPTCLICLEPLLNEDFMVRLQQI